MFERKITLGSYTRKTNSGSKKFLWILLLGILVFLAIWQYPITRKEVSENLTLPTPTEIK